MILSNNVTNFIEREIDYIEKSDWRHVIISWYIFADKLDREYEVWQDLVFTLQSAGINFLKDSYAARYNVMEGIIPSVIAKRYQEDRSLVMKDLLPDLNSFLGLSYEDIEDIVIKELQNYH